MSKNCEITTKRATERIKRGKRQKKSLKKIITGNVPRLMPIVKPQISKHITPTRINVTGKKTNMQQQQKS